jgi:hypothetical protein
VPLWFSVFKHRKTNQKRRRRGGVEREDCDETHPGKQPFRIV